jgi:hypothetical protein
MDTKWWSPTTCHPSFHHTLAGLLGSAKPGLRNDLRTLLSRGWPIPCDLCDQPEKNCKNWCWKTHKLTQLAIGTKVSLWPEMPLVGHVGLKHTSTHWQPSKSVVLTSSDPDNHGSKFNHTLSLFLKQHSITICTTLGIVTNLGVA